MPAPRAKPGERTRSPGQETGTVSSRPGAPGPFAGDAGTAPAAVATTGPRSGPTLRTVATVGPGAGGTRDRTGSMARQAAPRRGAACPAKDGARAAQHPVGPADGRPGRPADDAGHAAYPP